MEKYSVSGYPNIFFLRPDETELDRIEGYVPADRYLATMRKVLEAYGPVRPPAALRRATELLEKARAALAEGRKAEEERIPAAIALYLEILGLGVEGEPADAARAAIDGYRAEAASGLESARGHDAEGRVLEAAEALDRVAKVYRGLDEAKAATKALAALEADPAKGPALKKARREREAATALGGARAAETAKEWERAMGLYKDVARKFEGTEAAGTASARLAALEADPEVQRAIRDAKAEKECKNWLSLAESYVAAGSPDKARELCRKVQEKYPDTRWATRAQEILDSIP